MVHQELAESHGAISIDADVVGGANSYSGNLGPDLLWGAGSRATLHRSIDTVTLQRRRTLLRRQRSKRPVDTRHRDFEVEHDALAVGQHSKEVINSRPGLRGFRLREACQPLFASSRPSNLHSRRVHCCSVHITMLGPHHYAVTRATCSTLFLSRALSMGIGVSHRKTADRDL